MISLVLKNVYFGIIYQDLTKLLQKMISKITNNKQTNKQKKKSYLGSSANVRDLGFSAKTH